jgi:prepilin-type N-terminal cleavage/methylation domain-containing protein
MTHRPGGTSRRSDRGATLIEVLVAIVLLGTAAVAVVGALHVSVIGSRLERDHAKAYQWLQSADGVLQGAARVTCNLEAGDPYPTGEEKVRNEYQQLIRADVANPDGWQDHQLTVLEPVKIWDGSRYWDPAVAPKPCFDDDGFLLQLVELQVASPDGDIIETIQVVKRD